MVEDIADRVRTQVRTIERQLTHDRTVVGMIEMTGMLTERGDRLGTGTVRDV